MRRSKLAVLATALVGVVADGVADESARFRVAAGIVSAAFLATAVAIFALLDDAVATLLLGDDVGDAAIVGEAGSADAVASDGRADVANRARAKFGNALGGGWVHDEAFPSVASALAQRATLLRNEGVAVATGTLVAVVYRTKYVAGFVTVR